MGSPAVPANSQETRFHVVFILCLKLQTKWMMMEFDLSGEVSGALKKKSRREDVRRE